MKSVFFENLFKSNKMKLSFSNLNNNNSNNKNNNNNNNPRVGIRRGIAISHGQVKFSSALVSNHLEVFSPYLDKSTGASET